MRARAVSAIILLGGMAVSAAEPTEIPLWPEGVPEPRVPAEPAEKVEIGKDGISRRSNVSTPRLGVYDIPRADPAKLCSSGTTPPAPPTGPTGHSTGSAAAVCRGGRPPGVFPCLRCGLGWGSRAWMEIAGLDGDRGLGWRAWAWTVADSSCKPEAPARGIRVPARFATRIPLLALRAWMGIAGLDGDRGLGWGSRAWMESAGLDGGRLLMQARSASERNPRSSPIRHPYSLACAAGLDGERVRMQARRASEGLFSLQRIF